jgi:iron(III) transport system ATP-binding protein
MTSGRRRNLTVMSDGRIDIQGAVKSFGTLEVLRSVSLDVAAGEVVALLGPSGCGKTTLLRSIAGLERLQAGEIRIDGTVVSAPRIHVKPEERRIGMVFQDWALFPHLTVAENVQYGLSRDERRGGRVDEALDLVGLSGLGPRLPATLSGGQQQRVALARALAPRPRAILLDEPFSNLDTMLRVQVRAEVHKLLVELGITTVFVTHDQEEAFVLGDRVAVMHDGVIEQLATPATVYDTPSSRWVADFVGDANLLPGEGLGATATTPIGPVALRSEHRGPVEVLVRPEHLSVVAGDDATVELVEYYGHDHVIIVALDDGRSIRCRAPGAPMFSRGERVALKPNDVPSVAFARD